MPEPAIICHMGDEKMELKTPEKLISAVGTAALAIVFAVWCAGSSYSAWGLTAAVVSALLMLAFALGTVPLMLLFASLGALLPRGWTKYLRKLGAVLVTSMGLKMLIGGLLLLRG